MMYLLSGQSELMMNNLNTDILEAFVMLVKKNLTPSQIMRRIFAQFGIISPPEMAQYFEAVYSLEAIDFMVIIGSWRPDKFSDLTDEDFDRRILRIINKGNPAL